MNDPDEDSSPPNVSSAIARPSPLAPSAPSSVSLGSALALIVPQAISGGIALALVLPLARQIPALWEAAAAVLKERGLAGWPALLPPVASSLLTLAVASKRGLRDLAN